MAKKRAYNRKERADDFRLALRSTLPVMAGYLVLGIGLGFIMRSSGYGTLWSAAEAVFIYAGSMQYAAVGLLKDHASLLTAAVTTLAVNARHVFYGISMMEQYRDAGRGKGYLIFSLTDETYSLLCDRELTEKAHDRKRFFMTVSVIDHIYWITGCTLGGLFSSVIPDVASGAEFALTALFVSVFTGQWTGTEDHVPAVTGVSCSLLCLVLFGKDRFLIPSMLMIVAVLLTHRRKEHDA